MMKITALDHMVLTVRDVAATCEFYRRVLSMEVVTFASGRKALKFGDQKINLHQAGSEFEPHAESPLSGSADFCLVSDSDPEEIGRHLRACSVEIIMGPVAQEGARGPMTSYYFRDPDQNLVEVCTYPA